MDSQRALLDSLMGVNRNNIIEKNKIKNYFDDRICKNYLIGLCPHGNNIIKIHYNRKNKRKNRRRR